MNLPLFANDSNLQEISIYTDGACKGNPGRGSWAAILVEGSDRSGAKEVFGVSEETTNNQMELTAAIEGLRRLDRRSKVRVYSDSAYLVNAFRNNWIANWQKNGWRTKDRKAVKNRDLWELLISLCSMHDVCFEKVAGHSGDPLNERADQLANQALE